MQKHTHLFARYGGIVAVSFEWLALVIFYLVQPSAFNGNHPISYFATIPQTQVVFTICYLVAAFSFWVFASRHLNKYYRTPIKIFAFSMLTFAFMAIAPYNPDNMASDLIHTLLWQSSFLAFLVGMYIMARNNEDRRFHHVTLTAIVLSGLLLFLLRFTPQGSHLVLVFEAGAWFVCQLWIIWVSLLVHKKA